MLSLFRITVWTQTKQDQKWKSHHDFWKPPQVNLCAIGFWSWAAEAQLQQDCNLHLCHFSFLLILASVGDGLNPGAAMKRDLQTAWMWPPQRCDAMEFPTEQPSTLGWDRPWAGCAESHCLPKSASWLGINFCSFLSHHAGTAQQLPPALLTQAVQGHSCFTSCGCRDLRPPLESAPVSCSAPQPQWVFEHLLWVLGWVGFHWSLKWDAFFSQGISCLKNRIKLWGKGGEGGKAGRGIEQKEWAPGILSTCAKKRLLLH